MIKRLIVASKIKFPLAVFFCCMSFVHTTFATVPRPDHVVICILENHAYNQIIGSADAPYINTLVNMSANMQEYYGLTHPSQPNYLMFFSGDNQGETTDNLPHGTPWTTPNLGGSLLNAGFTFAGYSEDLPSPGSTVASSGGYARKHAPWVNWQGTGTNQIPDVLNLGMDAFPADFDHLPDLSFVIPNQNNDMHNGSDPQRIIDGDAWVEQHLKSYIDWCEANNSLFILTFDEDNFTAINQIPCLFIGPMVRQGNYYLNGYSHYDMLRTLEDMFSLPHSGASATAQPIEEIWMTTLSVGDFIPAELTSIVYPNPINDNSQIIITNANSKSSSSDLTHLFVYDVAGRIIREEKILLLPGKNVYAFRREGLANGIYMYQLICEDESLTTGKVVVN